VNRIPIENACPSYLSQVSEPSSNVSNEVRAIAIGCKLLTEEYPRNRALSLLVQEIKPKLVDCQPEHRVGFVKQLEELREGSGLKAEDLEAVVQLIETAENANTSPLAQTGSGTYFASVFKLQEHLATMQFEQARKSIHSIDRLIGLLRQNSHDKLEHSPVKRDDHHRTGQSKMHKVSDERILGVLQRANAVKAKGQRSSEHWEGCLRNLMTMVKENRDDNEKTNQLVAAIDQFPLYDGKGVRFQNTMIALANHQREMKGAGCAGVAARLGILAARQMAIFLGNPQVYCGPNSVPYGWFLGNVQAAIDGGEEVPMDEMSKALGRNLGEDLEAKRIFQKKMDPSVEYVEFLRKKRDR